MQRFLLISLILHAGLGLLLLMFDTGHDDMPLPGQPLELTLTTFSEAVTESRATIATAQTSRKKPARPATETRPVETPAGDQPAKPHPETTAAARVLSNPAAETPTDKESVDESATEPLAQTTPQTVKGNQASRQSVRAALYSALRARFQYPRRARMRGWEGTVVVSLRLMPDGALANVQLADSSGIPLLDRAAVRALARLQVPQAVAWLDGREMDMLIPVEYRLRDS